jgi:hypothetical protein
VNKTTSDIAAQALDVTEFAGSWVNTEPSPAAFAGFSFGSEDGVLRVRAFPLTGEPADAKVDGLYASSPSGREAVGFTAAYEGSDGEVELHANVSKGLLIVSSFMRNPGRASPPRVFAREFFRRSPEPLRQNSGVPGEARAALWRDESHAASIPIFQDKWINTQRSPALLASLTFSASDGPLSLRGVGLGARGTSAPEPFDVELLTDGPDLPELSKIRGRFRFEDRDILLHGWIKQEVMVLAYFVRFPSGGDRSGYFDREFFYREG